MYAVLVQYRVKKGKKVRESLPGDSGYTAVMRGKSTLPCGRGMMSVNPYMPCILEYKNR